MHKVSDLVVGRSYLVEDLSGNHPRAGQVGVMVRPDGGYSDDDPEAIINLRFGRLRHESHVEGVYLYRLKELCEAAALFT